MKIFIICLKLSFFILCSYPLKGQFFERQLISSFGDLSQTAEVSLSSTGGEVSIKTLRSNNFLLTTGFQQALPEDLVFAINPIYPGFDLSVRPNPFLKRFKLSFETTKDFPAYLLIIDAKGMRVISNLAFQLNAQQIITADCDHWEAGPYFLSIYDEDMQLLKSIQIQKL